MTTHPGRNKQGGSEAGRVSQAEVNQAGVTTHPGRYKQVGSEPGQVSQAGVNQARVNQAKVSPAGSKL